MNSASGLLASAQSALREGRLVDASRLTSQLSPSDPEYAGVHLELGIALLKAGQLLASIDSLERSIQKQPSGSTGFNWLSVAYRLTGRLDLAEQASLRAVHISPQSGLAHCNLGLVYLHQQRLDLAVSTLARAVELQPNEAQFRHNLGLALQGQGRDAEAGQQFRAAISLFDAAHPSYIALGGLMLKYGNPSGALDSARRVLSCERSSISAHLLAARALSNLGEEAQAEVHVRQVLDLSPDNSFAHSMLGFRLQTKGDFEGATAAFLRSVEINRVQGVGYWGLLQGRRATEEDRAELDSLIAISEQPSLLAGERSYLLFTIAKTFADLREYETAMRYYDLANSCAAGAQFGQKRFDSEAYARAIEKTKSLITEEFIKSNQHLQSPDSKPIFIVGMMRSGTTLMEQILSSHPCVSAGGELRFWLERGPKVVDISKPAVDAGLGRKLAADYLALLNRISSTDYVTDKMPENSQVLGLIHILFPNAKIIHMNRHPIDVCLSIYMTPYEISPDFAHVKENIAFAYRQHEDLMAHWRSVLPSGAFLDVRYEDLIDDVEATIRRVVDYCGLAWDDQCLRHSDNTRSVNTPSVWQVRQPIYSTSRNRWRHYEPYLGAFASFLEASE